MREPCGPVEGTERPRQAAVPAVRDRNRFRGRHVVCGAQRDGAQAFALRRSVLERPRELGQWAAARPACDVVLGEDGLDLVPERAGLARAAVVGGSLAYEIDALARTRARRVEEVAVARDLIGSRQPRVGAPVEVAARVVAEERGLVAAARQAPLLQPEQEHDLEAARASAQQVDHGDTSRLAGRGTADLGALDCRDELLWRKRPIELAPAAQLAEQSHDGVVGANVLPRELADRRRLEPIRGAQHGRGEAGDRVERSRRGAQRFEDRERLTVAQTDRLLLDALGRIDRTTTQPALEEVDVLARQTRVGRTQERVEVATVSTEPGKPQQAQERLAVRRLVEPCVRLERVWDAERPECCFEGRLPALERRAHDPDLFRRDAGPDQREQLLADELERPALAGALEEPDGSVDRRRSGNGFAEERALEMSERRL